MSHIAVVRCQVRDLDAFGEACEKLGGQLMVGQKTFRSWSNGTCEHAVRLKDVEAYEVGLKAKAEGGWDLAYDNYATLGGRLEQAFGPGLVNLQNQYLSVVAEHQLRRDGYMVQRFEEGQQIRLVAMA